MLNSKPITSPAASDSFHVKAIRYVGSGKWSRGVGGGGREARGRRIQDGTVHKFPTKPKKKKGKRNLKPAQGQRFSTIHHHQQPITRSASSLQRLHLHPPAALNDSS